MGLQCFIDCIVKEEYHPNLKKKMFKQLFHLISILLFGPKDEMEDTLATFNSI